MAHGLKKWQCADSLKSDPCETNLLVVLRAGPAAGRRRAVQGRCILGRFGRVFGSQMGLTCDCESVLLFGNCSTACNYKHMPIHKQKCPSRVSLIAFLCSTQISQNPLNTHLDAGSHWRKKGRCDQRGPLLETLKPVCLCDCRAGNRQRGRHLKGNKNNKAEQKL